jgi:hypothetical protein
MAEENPKVEENAEPKSPVQEEKPQEKDQTFHSEWTFWFDQSKSSKKPEKEDSFEETVVKLGTFNDIKGFWRFISLFTFSCRILTLTQFLAVSTPTLQSQIPCRPVQTWDFSEAQFSPLGRLYFPSEPFQIWCLLQNFAEGGCWIVRFSKNIRPNHIWEELVFSAVGERFEDDGIAGVVISRRKQDDYVSVWVKDNNLRFRIGYLVSFSRFFRVPDLYFIGKRWSKFSI